MSPTTIGLIMIVVLLFLLFSRMWIGAAMAITGFMGYMWLEGWDQALGVIATVPYGSIADYTLTVLPLFILMGNIVSDTGICGDLYKMGHKWMGALPGGLAMGTIGACMLFAAICGSSMAAAVTMGTVAVPEMRKFGYKDKLSTGTVAAGGVLGVLIPPSLGFIFYAILTEESVGLLFMAGVIPGIALALIFMITIYFWVRKYPDLAPAGPKTTFKEKIVSLKYTWSIIALFVFVMGGIYKGVFTPNEAGALGSFGALVITFIGRRLNMKIIANTLLMAGQITAMIVILLTGAMILMRFLALSQLPFVVSDFVAGLEMNRYIIFALLVIFYTALGMFLDIMAAVLLTIPIVFPTVVALGFDPIWFGVIVVMIMEMGMITPPVGMNVFFLSGVSRVPLAVIFRGVVPFVIAMLVMIVILTIFPQIALFLPSMMG